MSSAGNMIGSEPGAIAPADEPGWYAVQTRSRHEKKALTELRYLDVSVFLPLSKLVHRWSDRRKTVEVPLFPGYVFVNIVRTPEARLRVLKTNGVLSFVGDRGLGTPIPSYQIESIRTLMANDVPVAEHSFLSIGQRVLIHGGVLDGIEGILVATNGSRRLVISIESIQRSISISVEDYKIEVLGSRTLETVHGTR